MFISAVYFLLQIVWNAATVNSLSKEVFVKMGPPKEQHLINRGPDTILQKPAVFFNTTIFLFFLLQSCRIKVVLQIQLNNTKQEVTDNYLYNNWEYHCSRSILLTFHIVFWQLKKTPERYISHYEISNGRVLLYFNEVRFDSIITSVSAWPELKDFCSYSSFLNPRNALNLMRYRKWKLVSCSLLLLYFMIIMNQVSVVLDIDFIYWPDKVGVLNCLHGNMRTICVSLEEVKCTVFYSAPRRSKKVVTLCSDDVCQCAESRSPTKNVKSKKWIQNEIRVIIHVWNVFLWRTLSQNKEHIQFCWEDDHKAGSLQPRLLLSDCGLWSAATTMNHNCKTMHSFSMTWLHWVMALCSCSIYC